MYIRKLLLLTLAVLFTSSAQAQTHSRDYLEGYTTAILEQVYQIDTPVLRVRRNTLIIDPASLGNADQDQIKQELLNIPSIEQVEFGSLNSSTPPPRQTSEKTPAAVRETRKFFPQTNLFEPVRADPKWPHFAAKYLYYIDDEELTSVGVAQFGETMGLYRGEGPFSGHWQLNLQAGVFSIFDLDAASKDLVNSDFFVGVPITYRTGPLSAMLRVYHQSSHLGDEFLLRDPIERLNLSYEVVDAKISFDWGEYIRLYGGAGYIFHRIPESLEPGLVQLGFEIESPWNWADGQLQPIGALDLQASEENEWDGNLSIQAGVRFTHLKQKERLLDLLFEYYSGFSPNGQFYNRKIKYVGVGFHYHF